MGKLTEEEVRRRQAFLAKKRALNSPYTYDDLDRAGVLQSNAPKYGLMQLNEPMSLGSFLGKYVKEPYEESPIPKLISESWLPMVGHGLPKKKDRVWMGEEANRLIEESYLPPVVKGSILGDNRQPRIIGKGKAAAGEMLGNMGKAVEEAIGVPLANIGETEAEYAIRRSRERAVALAKRQQMARRSRGVGLSPTGDIGMLPPDPTRAAEQAAYDKIRNSMGGGKRGGGGPDRPPLPMAGSLGEQDEMSSVLKWMLIQNILGGFEKGDPPTPYSVTGVGRTGVSRAKSLMDLA
jgi:hypothetical protein